MCARPAHGGWVVVYVQVTEGLAYQIVVFAAKSGIKT